MRPTIVICLGVVMWSAGALPGQAADPISVAQFRKLQAMIKPHADEARWAEIPWLTDLWEARKKAAAEGKPLLVRYANGDPLGCT